LRLAKPFDEMDDLDVMAPSLRFLRFCRRRIYNEIENHYHVKRKVKSFQKGVSSSRPPLHRVLAAPIRLLKIR